MSRTISRGISRMYQSGRRSYSTRPVPSFESEFEFDREFEEDSLEFGVVESVGLGAAFLRAEDVEKATLERDGPHETARLALGRSATETFRRETRERPRRMTAMAILPSGDGISSGRRLCGFVVSRPPASTHQNTNTLPSNDLHTTLGDFP